MPIDKILSQDQLSRDDIIYLLSVDTPGELQLLFDAADKTRRKYRGEDVVARGVIDISNYCRQDCMYCNRRISNTALERFRVNTDEIISTAQKISHMGIKTLVLKSGEDEALNADRISYIIYSVKQLTNLFISLSLGQRDFEDYKIWKYSGADRYILRYETSNQHLYYKYHNHKRLKDRIRHIQYLKSLGFQIGIGSLIGLPEQTIDEIADDVILNRTLDADLVSFSTFIPLPGSPLEKEKSGSVLLTLKSIAIARLLLKDRQISVTRSISILDPTSKEKAVKAGADVVLPDFTPEFYREKFSHISI